VESGKLKVESGAKRVIKKGYSANNKESRTVNPAFLCYASGMPAFISDIAEA